MNKSEFVTYMSEKNNIAKAEAERALNMIVETVTNALADGESVNLVGFGSFAVNHVPARQGRNPQTGNVIQIKASNQPKFKAGKALKEACN